MMEKFKRKETYVEGKLFEYVDNYHSKYKKNDIINEKNKNKMLLKSNLIKTLKRCACT